MPYLLGTCINISNLLTKVNIFFTFFIQKKIRIKFSLSWQCPIFAYTIVGDEELNFCVRDGNRCTLFSIITKKNILEKIILWKLRYCVHQIILIGLNPRSISTGQLKMSPFFHLQPINLIVSEGSYYIKYGKIHLKGGFPLRCFQRLSFPYIATLRCSWRYNRYTRGMSIPVLSY